MATTSGTTFVTVDAPDPDRRDHVARGLAKLARPVRAPWLRDSQRDPASEMFATLLAAASATTTTLLPWGATCLSFHPLGALARRLWQRVAPRDAVHVALAVPCDPNEAFDASITGGLNLSMTLEDFSRAARACADPEALARLAADAFGARDVRVHVVRDPEEAYRALETELRG